MEQYEINVNVRGAPSGSEKYQIEKGHPTVTPTERRRIEAPTVDERFEEQRERENLLNTTSKKVSAGALAIGSASLQVYEQNAQFRGDSNKLNKINRAKKTVSMAASIVAGFAVGGPVGGAIAIGYTAFNLALENRKLIHESKIDTYKSQYYQERLIVDVTKRSRY